MSRYKFLKYLTYWKQEQVLQQLTAFDEFFLGLLTSITFLRQYLFFFVFFYLQINFQQQIQRQPAGITSILYFQQPKQMRNTSNNLRLNHSQLGVLIQPRNIQTEQSGYFRGLTLTPEEQNKIRILVNDHLAYRQKINIFALDKRRLAQLLRTVKLMLGGKTSLSIRIQEDYYNFVLSVNKYHEEKYGQIKIPLRYIREIQENINFQRFPRTIKQTQTNKGQYKMSVKQTQVVKQIQVNGGESEEQQKSEEYQVQEINEGIFIEKEMRQRIAKLIKKNTGIIKSKQDLQFIKTYPKKLRAKKNIFISSEILKFLQLTLTIDSSQNILLIDKIDKEYIQQLLQIHYRPGKIKEQQKFIILLRNFVFRKYVLKNLIKMNRCSANFMTPINGENNKVTKFHGCEYYKDGTYCSNCVIRITFQNQIIDIKK